MALEWFKGAGQTIAGSAGIVATLGLNQNCIDFAEDGVSKVKRNNTAAWGADGEATKVAESLPVVGLAAAAGHGISASITGDHDSRDRAKRATAASTKSTMVTAGAVGGFAVGGPIGAGVGAAPMSAGGQCAEKGINQSINKKEFQTEGGTYL